MTRLDQMTAEQRIRHALEADFIASPRLGLVPTGPLIDYMPRPVTLPEMPESLRVTHDV